MCQLDSGNKAVTQGQDRDISGKGKAHDGAHARPASRVQKHSV